MDGIFFRGFTIGNAINSLPHAGTLWFIRELMTVMLLSPLISLAIDKLKWIPLVAFYLFWSICFVGRAATYLQFFSSALMFFSLGVYFSKCGVDPAERFTARLRPALIIFLIIGITGMVFTYIGINDILYIRLLKTVSVPCALIVVFAIAGMYGSENGVRQKLFGNVPPFSTLLPRTFILHICGTRHLSVAFPAAHVRSYTPYVRLGFGRRIHCLLYRYSCSTDGALPADRESVASHAAHSHRPELMANHTLSLHIMPTV